MAGGLMRYRTLSRKSSHRRALLRNLVTSLFMHESISTTWPKAKEAQRLAEKLITLGKKNTPASKLSAQSWIFRPHEVLPRLFGPIRERYASRPGGYTRVLRIEPAKEDQAPSALLELVDGPKDMRMALTARTIAYQKQLAETENRNFQINDMTKHNIMKVTRFRKDGKADLDDMVKKFGKLYTEGDFGVEEVKKKRVYHELERSR